jgi:hypothetical protein
MEWFSQKTSIAGIQVPNWTIVLGVVIVKSGSPTHSCTDWGQFKTGPLRARNRLPLR